MNLEMKHVRRAKTDSWVVLILTLISVVFFVAGVKYLFLSTLSNVVGIFYLLIPFGIVWFVRSRVYEIDESSLTIRNGLFRSNISLDSIEEIIPTHGGIQIKYFKSDDQLSNELVSPDNEGLLDDLIIAIPDLEKQGERFVRR